MRDAQQTQREIVEAKYDDRLDNPYVVGGTTLVADVSRHPRPAGGVRSRGTRRARASGSGPLLPLLRLQHGAITPTARLPAE